VFNISSHRADFAQPGIPERRINMTKNKKRMRNSNPETAEFGGRNILPDYFRHENYD
jgi:hypothetical protein